MSEYQYYEFQAIDRPLTDREMSTLRNYSSRATIDEAVRLLGDLKDLGARSGRIAEVQSRIQRIREEHSRKPSFIERLQRAGLLR